MDIREQKKNMILQLKRKLDTSTNEATCSDFAVLALIDPEFPDIKPESGDEENCNHDCSFAESETEDSAEWSAICTEQCLTGSPKESVLDILNSMIDSKRELKKNIKDNYKYLKQLRENLTSNGTEDNSNDIAKGIAENVQRNKKLMKDIADEENLFMKVLQNTKYSGLYTAMKGEIKKHKTLRRVSIEDKLGFICNECDFTSTSTGAVETHMFREHNYPAYTCSFCTFEATNSRALYSHNKRKHGINLGIRGTP